MLTVMTTADADTPRHADPPGTSTPKVGAPGAGLQRMSAVDLAHDRASPRGCPFLLSESGGWRLGLPSREHRCGAFTPPASLSPEKQARLCLTPKHIGCATYLASLNARTERLGAPPLRRATRWGLARTTSVIEDPGGVRARILGAVLDRRRWPAIPALILVTTLFVLALSGLRAGLPASAVATASPGQPATQPAPSLGSTEHPIASEAAGSPPSDASAPASPGKGAATPATGTAQPAGTARPAATFRTYKVRSGDTLAAIAGKYGTTISALVDLNDLSDAGRLSIGQVLLIP
jgi:LysM repeat protein